MPIKRSIPWGYYCKGNIPVSVSKHTLTIGAWYLSTTMKDMLIMPVIIDFVVDKYAIDFDIYLEPSGEYAVVEALRDGLPKQNPFDELTSWQSDCFLPICSGVASKKNELSISMSIEELAIAEREIPDDIKDDMDKYNATN